MNDRPAGNGPTCGMGKMGKEGNKIKFLPMEKFIHLIINNLNIILNMEIVFEIIFLEE